MNDYTPSPADIQSHVFSALLQGTTPDVALRVRGSWSAVYKLHRLILTQSGFFHSLFTSGFLESSHKRRSSVYGYDVVDIVFPDQNITRAAFEICIARLYGGGPALHVPSSLVPTAAEPLTPSFPISQEAELVPPNHHPVTPRFLLSLLATSIYLSIPSIASQALSLILSTVGPTTVVSYLNFALGKPLDLLAGELETARGLENIALPIEDEEDDLTIGTHSEKQIDDFSDLLSDLAVKEDTSSEESVFIHEDDSDDGITCHYGAVSNKIGEACACWLARWAVDILIHEQTLRPQASLLAEKKISPAELSSIAGLSERCHVTIWSRGGLSAKWVAALVSSDTLFVKNERHRYDFARNVVELRRADGILLEEEAEWTNMFETGIYYNSMSTEDIINISNDVSPATNRSFVPLQILQAAHWDQSVLRHKIISLPCSPLSSTTPREKELGITLFTSDIRTQSPGSGLPGGSNLEAQKAYFPVPSDSSLRIGDNGTAFNGAVDGPPMSMDELFKFTDNPSVSASHSSNGRTVHRQSSGQVSPLSTSESTFFGILTSRQTGSSCIASDSSGKGRWSPYPPCRFSVEFWDYDGLKEKNRLYSETIWYAGSLFNVYIQIIRKKGQGQTQLGVYVHRQSSIDPIPSPSIYVTPPSPTNGSGEASDPLALVRNRDRYHYGGSSQSSSGPSHSPLHYSPSIHPLVHTSSAVFSSTGRPASPNSPGSGSPSPLNASISNFVSGATTRAPGQPYRDPRAMIAAYFMVSCASATGSSQTRFSSAPDVFSVGQSWGWKSSSLKSEEYVDFGGEEDGEAFALPARKTRHGKEVSFRATVVVGLV